MKALSLIVVILVCPFLVEGQSVIQVSGTIKDAESGETLPTANVFLLSDVTKGTVSNLKGEFSIDVPISENEITIVFSFLGYQEITKALVPKENIKLEILLNPIAQQVQEVVISAEKLIAEEFTVEKVNKIGIYTNPLSKADPVLAVNAMAAATTTDESANISLRGSSPAETGLFLNNVPIYDAVRFAQINGIGTFSIFNTAIVNNIQVFPSNPPLEFGNTTAGLIAIQTDGIIPPQNLHSVSINLASLGLNSTFKLGNTSSLTAFANYQPSQALKWLNSDALENLKDFNSIDFGLHFYSKLGENTELKVFNYSLNEGYDFLSKHPSADVLFQQGRIRNFTVATLRKVLKNGEITINHGNSWSNFQLEGNNLDFANFQRDLYFSANFQQQIKKFSYKTGVTVDSRFSRFNGIFPQFDYAYRKSDPTIFQAYTNALTVSELYYYAKYLLGEKWTIGGGLRKNIPDNEQKSYWSYQMNIHYRFLENNSLNFSIGNYHKYNLPDGSFNNTYLIGSQQIAIDYEYKNRGLTMHAALFRKDTQLHTLENLVYGGEIFFNWKHKNKLDVRASFTYIHAEFIDGEITYESPFDLDFFIKGALEYKFNPTWTLGSSWLFRQGTFYTPVLDSQFDTTLGLYQPIFDRIENQERLPNYSLLNLNISKIISTGETSNLILFGSVNNVLNRQNVRDLEYNADYSSSTNALFSKRIFFVGGVFNF